MGAVRESAVAVRLMGEMRARRRYTGSCLCCLGDRESDALSRGFRYGAAGATLILGESKTQKWEDDGERLHFDVELDGFDACAYELLQATRIL